MSILEASEMAAKQLLISPILLYLCLSLLMTVTAAIVARPPEERSTRFYNFTVEPSRITKLCNTRDIITVNGMYPGPVVYAQEDDRVIVRVTNKSPYNLTIHWHGVRQMLSCWSDGPSYITQCPIQPGNTYTYNFTLLKQKGTFFWHAHYSWLRATVHGVILVYPKTGVPYPFIYPYQEHTLILGEYWMGDLLQLDQTVAETGGIPPIADAFTINGHPGPNYKCSNDDVYKLDVVPGKTYLLRLINAALNTEHFFAIANHKLTIVETDAEYTKPFTVDHVMLAPGQTHNVLVTADQPNATYSISMGPYVSARNLHFQNETSVAYFHYMGASPGGPYLPALVPKFDDNLAANAVMDGLRSLATSNVPITINENLFVTIGLNVQKCHSKNPKQNCQGINGGVMAASMNNISFIMPNVSLLEAYYRKFDGYFTEDFPGTPLKFYDFVNGAPNKPPSNTGSLNGSRTYVLDYGTRVQLILQDTGTVTTENHPIHLHGYSFYVVGYGTGNYNPETADLNLVDPPYMNTIAVPVGGWAAIRFVADNPGVWFMHCHLEMHLSWGLSVVFIVRDGKGPLQTLPLPPPDLPRC